jgi:dipeptidase E
VTGLGWISVGVLELTVLPGIGADRRVPGVREADVLLVNGGDADVRAYAIDDQSAISVTTAWSTSCPKGGGSGSTRRDLRPL